MSHWVTSAPYIIDNHNIFEGLIRGSTTLLGLNQTKANDKGLETWYINVLFAFWEADGKHKSLKSIAYHNEGHVIALDLQRLLRGYLSELDSALDYLDKLSTYLRKSLCNATFQRKEQPDLVKVNLFRNSVLHEGMPELRLSDHYEVDYGCHADMSGDVTSSRGYLDVKVRFRHHDEWLDLVTVLATTFDPTHKAIGTFTKEQINRFSTCPME